MEVPRRPQPLPPPARGAADRVSTEEPTAETLQEKSDGAAEDDPCEEENPDPSETSEMSDAAAHVKVSSEEDRERREEEEAAAAKERTAQRQLFAIEELVQSERNYLRLLQVSTVTVRSNLQKLQVRSSSQSGQSIQGSIGTSQSNPDWTF